MQKPLMIWLLGGSIVGSERDFAPDHHLQIMPSVMISNVLTLCQIVAKY